MNEKYKFSVYFCIAYTKKVLFLWQKFIEKMFFPHASYWSLKFTIRSQLIHCIVVLSTNVLCTYQTESGNKQNKRVQKYFNYILSVIKIKQSLWKCLLNLTTLKAAMAVEWLRRLTTISFLRLIAGNLRWVKFI